MTSKLAPPSEDDPDHDDELDPPTWWTRTASPLAGAFAALAGAACTATVGVLLFAKLVSIEFGTPRVLSADEVIEVLLSLWAFGVLVLAGVSIFAARRLARGRPAWAHFSAGGMAAFGYTALMLALGFYLAPLAGVLFFLGIGLTVAAPFVCGRTAGSSTAERGAME